MKTPQDIFYKFNNFYSMATKWFVLLFFALFFVFLFFF